MKYIKCENCCFHKKGKEFTVKTQVIEGAYKGEINDFSVEPEPFCTLMIAYLPTDGLLNSIVIECPEFKAKKL